METTELTDGVVRLVPPGPADVDAVADLCQDEAIQEWTVVPSPYTRSHAEAFVDDWVVGGWAEGRECTWGIRSAGRLVGMIGLSMRPARSAEIGYWLGADARGRGLMQRAVTLVLDHAFDPDGLDLEHVEWHAYAGNWASWRTAWRAGFRFEGVVRKGAVQRGVRRDDWVGTLLRTDSRGPAAPWPATTIDAPVPHEVRAHLTGPT